MLFTCRKGSEITKLKAIPDLEKWNKFFKRFAPTLFCKFNKKKNLIEVWDINFRGKEYFIKEIKDSLGNFRFPDNRDLQDLWKRSFERRRKVWHLEDEVDKLDAEWEHWSDLKHQHVNYQISMDKFNIIFDNPMIGGV